MAEPIGGFWVNPTLGYLEIPTIYKIQICTRVQGITHCKLDQMVEFIGMF